MKEAIRAAIEALETCSTHYYRDIDGDRAVYRFYDEDKVNSALSLLREAGGGGEDADRLHQQIMNLSCNVPPNRANSSAVAYQQGHRDARHAAAELALAAMKDGK